VKNASLWHITDSNSLMMMIMSVTVTRGRCCCTTCISASIQHRHGNARGGLSDAICHFPSLDTFKTHLFSAVLFYL